MLTAVAVVASIAVILPLVFLLVQAVQVGWGTLDPLLFRSLTAQLLWNTVSLTVVVMVLCAVIGTVTAWFVERTQIPGRRFWAVLVVIPLGIPDFVVSFGWRAIFPSFGGFWAAVLVMTMAVYPLVYLPVAASLRNADPAQEEVARSLGLGRLATFWRVTVGQARLAILGGAVLVGLVVLAEFGAFEILGFRTLTTEIYTEFTVGFSTSAGCAFSLILVVLGAALLLGESACAGAAGAPASVAGVARQMRPVPLGRARPGRAGRGGSAGRRWRWGCPWGRSSTSSCAGATSTLPPASLLGAAGNTFFYSACAGLLATVAALPIALLSIRYPRREVRLLERSNMLILGVPGLVIALAFTYFTEHYLARASSTRRPCS